MLELRDLAAPGGAAVTAEVEAGGWVRVEHPDADGLVAAAAGLVAGGGTVVLAGVDLGPATAETRARAGLGTVPGVVPPIPALRVLDVLLLARPAAPLRSWQAGLGLRRPRAELADDEAFGRALAGRLGLARWVDEPAVDLPPEVAALADLGRVVAARPLAVVWRAPQWLSVMAASEAEDALRAEQARAGWPVLEVRAPRITRPRGPLVIEVGS